MGFNFCYTICGDTMSNILKIILCLLILSQISYCYDINASIERSLALTNEPFAYTFECGYYIDGRLIHEGTPKYNGTWWGYATSDIIVIRAGLAPKERMMTLAHEIFHQDRMRAGLFNKFNRWLEEKLAYIHGYNESNWDSRINRFHCVEE